jgi:4'-phosphopantetheinyl transferase
MASTLILDIGCGMGDRLFAWGFPRLTEEERDRVARFRNAEDRNRMVCGRLLLRVQIARWLGSGAADAFSLAYSAHGRPSLPAHPDFDFNISHSGSWVACASISGGRIGIDVESARGPGGEIAERYFPEAEKAWLRAAPAAEREERFLQLWTLKEAFVKADGRGLSVPLDSFAFRIESGRDPRLVQCGWAAPGDWEFASQRLGALAWLGAAYPAGETLEVIRIAPQALLACDGNPMEEIGRHA